MFLFFFSSNIYSRSPIFLFSSNFFPSLESHENCYNISDVVKGEEGKIDNFLASQNRWQSNFFFFFFRQQLSILIIIPMMMIWVWRFNQQKFPLLIAQPRHFPLSFLYFIFDKRRTMLIDIIFLLLSFSSFIQQRSRKIFHLRSRRSPRAWKYSFLYSIQSPLLLMIRRRKSLLFVSPHTNFVCRVRVEREPTMMTSKGRVSSRW